MKTDATVVILEINAQKKNPEQSDWTSIYRTEVQSFVNEAFWGFSKFDQKGYKSIIFQSLDEICLAIYVILLSDKLGRLQKLKPSKDVAQCAMLCIRVMLPHLIWLFNLYL